MNFWYNVIQDLKVIYRLKVFLGESYTGGKTYLKKIKCDAKDELRLYLTSDKILIRLIGSIRVF